MSSDDRKKSLTLLEKELDLATIKARNYWNTVGKNKEYFPSEPRPESIPTFNKHGRVLVEPKDEWWINSKNHNFCFWSYLRDNSQPDGTMEPLLQSEIADLFGCSSTKVHFMLKEAMDKLMSDENMKILQNLLILTEDEPQEHNTEILSIGSINQLTEDEDSE